MINYFNFTKFKEKILITNETGHYCFLTLEQFKEFISDRIDYDTAIGHELLHKYFVFKDSKQEFLNQSTELLRINKGYLLQSTSLHIFVLTNSCNLRCIYCQAKKDSKYKLGMMTLETASKAVEFALQSPNNYLTFEFQGGEPLLNFEALKHIVEYTECKKGNRHIQYNLVSNITKMTPEIISFIKKYNIGVSTSLDGDETVHDINRSYATGAGTYCSVVTAIKDIRKQGVYIGAIQTTSKYGLSNAKELVDTYINNKMEYIFIRPLTPLGCAFKEWDTIGYSPEEFIEFYKECFNYIIEANKSGIRLVEGHASIFLRKILKLESGNYMELRSPCGGAIGQIAYYYDGDIYTCDEGRMLGEMGNKEFKLGNVFDNTYRDIIYSPKCTAVMAASFLGSIPECCDCVYLPYCGTCPVLNFALENDIFPRTSNNYRCKIYKGILEIIFNFLYQNDSEIINIFHSWIN